MKSYTDLSQSKKLAKILPIESADMYYSSGDECDICFGNGIYEEIADWLSDGTQRPADIPCWSLTALLEILAKIANKIDDDGSASLSSFMGQWSVDMFDCPVESTDNYDSPIDACVAMIENLHKTNLL